MWNAIPQALRNLSKNALKIKFNQILFNILGSQDSHIDLSEIIQNVKSVLPFSVKFNWKLIKCVCICKNFEDEPLQEDFFAPQI